MSMSESTCVRSAKRPQARQPRYFSDTSLFVTKDSEMKKYERRDADKKVDMKWGQFKLLSTEMEALLWFWDPVEVPNLKVVYAGAAPGNHFTILTSLFPSVEWFLYDPQPFSIEPNDKVHIFNCLFTDGLAKEWSGRKDVFFFSDIRSVCYREVSSEDNERGIWKDMQMQERWTLIINPYRASLKMRLPYFNPFNKRTVEYLYGYVMLQPFTGPTSTETRLIPIRDEDGKYFRTVYDVKEYEEKLFHHNTVIRETSDFRNSISGTTVKLMGGNFDVSLLTFIMERYAQRTGLFNGESPSTAFNVVLDLIVYVIEELSKACKRSKVEWCDKLLLQMYEGSVLES